MFLLDVDDQSDLVDPDDSDDGDVPLFIDSEPEDLGDTDDALFIDCETEDLGETSKVPPPELLKALPLELLETTKMFQQELQHQEEHIQQQQGVLAARLECLLELKSAVTVMCTSAWNLALTKCEAAELDTWLLQSGNELVETLHSNTKIWQDLLSAAFQNDIDVLMEALKHARQAHMQDVVIQCAEERLDALQMKAANVILSVPYDVQGPTPYAQLMDASLRHQGLFTYNPNTRTKRDCGQECCITGYQCTKVPYMPPVKPTDTDCWQSSYRWHLEYPALWSNNLKKAVMLCIKQAGHLGSGQVIEKRMAENLGVLRIEVDASASADPLEFVNSFPQVLEQAEQEFKQHGIL